MEKYKKKNIVWLDADSIVEKEPTLFKEIDKNFGVHYIDGQFASGTLFFKNNNISRNILKDWISENSKNENAWDQVTLSKIINDKYKNEEYILPKEYCSIFDRKGYQDIDKVISHWQASRKLKNDYKKKKAKTNDVNIWCNLTTKNYGDAVNYIFWKKLTNKNIIFDSDKIHYITTGSIMNMANSKSIIMGAGFISEKGDLGGRNFNSKINKKYCEPHKIISVRGPLTRKKLISFDVKCPKNYGDPLIIMPCIYNKSKIIKKDIIGIIPHYVDKNTDNYNLLYNNLKNNGYDVKYIDIQIKDNYEKLLSKINDCKYIISSSLHGVMMGIVYKKQTIYIQFTNKVVGGNFKFNDFFGSLNIKYKNINKYDNNILNNIINIDYNKLITLQKKFISLIPFIDNKIKNNLKNKIDVFYNDI